MSYTCTSCLKESVNPTPRMAMTFEAHDGTGDYTLTAYTDNAERLLEVKVVALYSMPAQERNIYLGHVEDKLRNTKLYIQVVPGRSLFRTQELNSVLNQVSLI
ncbi:uncharacterized protein LOC141658717 [Silene latifolia]|uniref:uncharacterized protein LOC141658717 n=1 Tax=Silene latifolia TaxID=37657 RepID=UPI003D784567